MVYTNTHTRNISIPFDVVRVRLAARPGHAICPEIPDSLPVALHFSLSLILCDWNASQHNSFPITNPGAFPPSGVGRVVGNKRNVNIYASYTFVSTRTCKQTPLRARTQSFREKNAIMGAPLALGKHTANTKWFVSIRFGCVARSAVPTMDGRSVYFTCQHVPR